ncbi:tumor susceptibility gene 101 protein [Elysia marginata]|uniref:Tumor susceptibility gene 101 protein n=1 Tax=Elysia marginata TaxID=1093978 RepID=A0AAV4EN25_9GAST|nr:tumor susceptibility gene 101 protein [Elysia marginata]
MAHETTLRNYLSTSKYKYQNEARFDIMKTLAQYKDLRPSLDPFVFNNGVSKKLVQLEGTIPVTYKGNLYNIPISLWLQQEHPYNPPMVFVKPTSTMQIKPSQHVDANGKVDIPVLREWRHPTSDLLTVVQVLILMFGDECPVFSRASNRGPPTQQPLTYPGSTPYPTNPGGMPMPAMPYPPAGSTGPPGYPPAGGMPYLPYPPATGQGYPNHAVNQPYPGSGYPPVSQGGGMGGYPPYPPSSGNLAYPGSHPPGPPSYTGPGSYPPATQFNNHQPQFSAVNNVGNAVQPPTFTRDGTVTEADVKASLLSAVEDKIKRRLKETFAQAQAEMDVLTKTQTDLNQGKQKLEQIISDLEKEKEEISKNIGLLSNKDDEVKEAIQKMEAQEEVNIDEAVVTTTPLYRQLVDAFAEEQAIEDAIYYLGEALRKNVIELESFLKRVRELSRKQFMLRATIQKCREKAGLPPLV